MKRIFKNDDWEELSKAGGIPHFGYYHPYRLPDGSRNPKFSEDRISGLILDVKDGKEKGLNFFFNALQPEIESNVTICVVPSHEASDANTSGIAKLAKRLASVDRIDKIDFLLRGKTISKLATGGERSYQNQIDSIKVNPNMSVSGDVILLVDDVTTSGKSLQACRDILLENGATRVAMFALGESRRD